MEVKPQLLVGKVNHMRLIPKKNAFKYGIYYLALPLSHLSSLEDGFYFGLNRFALLSFYDADYGNQPRESLNQWKADLLDQYGITEATGETILVTMPRVIGYVFNPVSFWLCLDQKKQLRAVISEVSNTYGEKHFYLCSHADQRVIEASDMLSAEKVFHVSPFIERSGSYQFRFGITDNQMSISINHFNVDEQCLLTTSLHGDLQAFSRRHLIGVFSKYPLVTLMAITRIHWQALKLFTRRIRFIDKPEQHLKTVTRTK